MFATHLILHGVMALEQAIPNRSSSASRNTAIGAMVHDAQRFVPALAGVTWRESLFTVKTVLLKNDRDDGRPILFRPTPELPGLYSILGSKLDNIYDLFELVNSLRASIDRLPRSAHHPLTERASCSRSGFRRYFSDVSSSVWINISAGMPDTSLRLPRRRTSSSE